LYWVPLTLIWIPSPLSTSTNESTPPILFCTFNGKEVFKSVPSLPSAVVLLWVLPPTKVTSIWDSLVSFEDIKVSISYKAPLSLPLDLTFNKALAFAGKVW
jgi:hypothetical protein